MSQRMQIPNRADLVKSITGKVKEGPRKGEPVSLKLYRVVAGRAKTPKFYSELVTVDHRDVSSYTGRNIPKMHKDFAQASRHIDED